MRYQYYYGYFSSFCSWDALHYCNCLHSLKVTYCTVTCLTSLLSGFIESTNTSLHGYIYPSKPISYMCDAREYTEITFLQMAQQVSPLKLSHIFRKHERYERKSCQTSIMLAVMVCNIHECDVATQLSATETVVKILTGAYIHGDLSTNILETIIHWTHACVCSCSCVFLWCGMVWCEGRKSREKRVFYI